MSSSRLVLMAATLFVVVMAPACRGPAGVLRDTGAATPGLEPRPTTWWKGNLHTHSLWSDGEDYPEMIAAWYRDQGYHFLAFTEHDLLQQGERWLDINAEDPGWPPRNRSARLALPAYRDRFGAWVDERLEGDAHFVRLRPLAEYRVMFEATDRFLLLMGEEITDREGAHVNAIEPEHAILPVGGATPADRIRNNLAAVAEQRRVLGRPILSFVNHPNFTWALTAEEIAAIDDARFFEVYNGHALVNNAGDAERAGTERIWDIVLSLRLTQGRPLLYGVANDDAHDYRDYGGTVSRPGRGWIHVRSPRLAAADLIAAIEAGAFYASTGVTLRDVRCTGGRLRIEIAPNPVAEYRVDFVGTRAGQSLASRAVVNAAGDTLRTTRSYDAGVGAVLATVAGPTADYVFAGDELYVRARITSTSPQLDPTTGAVLGVQMAWTQPVRPPAAGSECTD